ncbi:biliverdin-producing heme oxygenase [Paeniroseomonas aquatica]|uniref:Biliverdin-producing heme oxygenase n=1 Tax=Paeniroseomonas aquatica TaxID=373043 RepID=A0ABT8A163_9PROT|nr:biliverdin-producing heme oxygenase [Paeniroseomonas aquatica]MDN3563441.1 biliverdin-producing heme oxygenase [Paeniroseomonas aquatica]
MAAAGARMLLREATAEVHARLHGVPAFRALAEGRLSLPAYGALLGRLLGFHAAVEAALAAAPSLLPYGIDLAERGRSAALRADLAALGLTPPEYPPLAPVPRLDTAARALGCLYVTEGSTLGGRQLARGLDPLLPGGGEAGRAFLLGHGARHGAMWQACCAAVEACGSEPGGLAGMAAAAGETFAAFEAWFAPGAGGLPQHGPAPAAASGEARAGGRRRPG